jgi:uncharacterized protein YdhG (YjbR/CyaY superfamily)
MQDSADAPETVEEYISRFPPKVKAKLKKMRSVIKAAAPGAVEKIGYGMPAYKLNGDLVFFAAFDRHIGFYALPGAMVVFKKELSRYKSAKGSVQFPLDEDPPYELIEEIVKFRVKENEKRAAEKQALADKKAVAKKKAR